MKPLTYKVILGVITVTPDPTAYNQQRQIYSPVSVEIAVDVPITPDNFYLTGKQFEEIKLWELGTGDKPKFDNLQFTPLGWKRVMNMLEEPYLQTDSLWEEDETDFDLYKE